MIEQTVGNSGHGNSLSTSIRWMFYMENFWAFPCQTFGSACVSDGSRWELPRGGAISPCWNVHHFEKRSINYKWPFSIISCVKSQGGMNQQKFDMVVLDVPKTLEGFGGFQWWFFWRTNWKLQHRIWQEDPEDQVDLKHSFLWKSKYSCFKQLEW